MNNKTLLTDFVIMWAIPWKTIDENKRSEADISSYRPFGPTCITSYGPDLSPTHTLYDYATAHSLLSSSPDGFRNQKDEVYQL